ncbi:MAG: hypothetical protein IKW33_03490 [Clostridia bacterium]|nr:hypothetical protein [Clostridia bacterium]
MEFFNISVFFELYGLPATLIAIFVSIVVFLIEKFLVKKDSFKKIKGLILFSSACVINFLYNAIFVLGYLSFDQKSISSTFICGSISLAVSSIITSIINGKSGKLIKTTFILEKLLVDFVPNENLSATAIAISALLEGISEKQVSKENLFAIKEVLKSNVKDLTDNEIDEIVNKIVAQINTPKI